MIGCLIYYNQLFALSDILLGCQTKQIRIYLLGVVGINTPWHFRYLQQVQMPIYTVSSPRPLETGMNSLIL